MRDQRPEIPAWRRRAPAEAFDPAAVAAERRRLEAEQRRAAPQATPDPEAKPESEPEAELEELGAGEKRRVRDAVRQLRGG
jgi:hypothetical protein